MLNNDNVLNLIQNINGDTKLHYDYNNLFYELIDKSDILAKEPEGYIFKWKKNLYQLIFNNRERINPEKTQYEYLLCDFVYYCKSIKYKDKIHHSYVKQYVHYLMII